MRLFSEARNRFAKGLRPEVGGTPKTPPETFSVKERSAVVSLCKANGIDNSETAKEKLPALLEKMSDETLKQFLLDTVKAHEVPDRAREKEVDAVFSALITLEEDANLSERIKRIAGDEEIEKFSPKELFRKERNSSMPSSW